MSVFDRAGTKETVQNAQCTVLTPLATEAVINFAVRLLIEYTYTAKRSVVIVSHSALLSLGSRSGRFVLAAIVVVLEHTHTHILRHSNGALIIWQRSGT